MSARLQTAQGDRVKTAFETLKDFGTECVVIFRSKGVELIGLDNARVVDVRFFIDADLVRATGGEYFFDSQHDIVLGARTKLVVPAIKRFNPGDQMAIEVKRGNHDRMTISCTNNDKSFRIDIVAPAVEDPSSVVLDIRSLLHFTSTPITMGSMQFYTIIGDICIASPSVVAITCTNNSLRFFGEGSFSQTTVEMGSVVCVDSAPWTVTESFSLDHLHKIAKAKNISAQLRIHIAHDKPAFFEYETPIGPLTFLVGAVQEEEDAPRQIKRSIADETTERKRSRPDDYDA